MPQHWALSLWGWDECGDGCWWSWDVSVGPVAGNGAGEAGTAQGGQTSSGERLGVPLGAFWGRGDAQGSPDIAQPHLGLPLSSSLLKASSHHASSGSAPVTSLGSSGADSLRDNSSRRVAGDPQCHQAPG